MSSKSVQRRAKRVSIDKRSRRTRGALAMALIDLVPRHGIDRLDVRRLAAAAGVGRSTFYKHYADKDDFLIKSFAGMVGGMDAHARRHRRDYDTMLPAKEVFEHMEEARAFALSMAASGEFGRTIAAREDVVRAIADENLKRLRPGLSLPRRQEAVVVLAGVFVSLMRWWMEGGMRRRADEVAALYDAAARRLLER